MSKECWSCDHKNSSVALSDVSKHSIPMEKVIEGIANTDGKHGSIFLEITNKPILVDALLGQHASCDECGAISTFLGVTRNHFDGKKVTQLEYEAFSSMAMREIEKIALDIFGRFSQIHRVVISHRIGVVPVREASVFIAVTSEHRHSGLDAVAFAINTLKARVPIWKKEIYEDEIGGLGSTANPSNAALADSKCAGKWKKNSEFVEHPASPLKATSDASSPGGAVTAQLS